MESIQNMDSLEVSEVMALATQVLLFGGLLLGLALLLLGRKMARPGCALTGLVLAGMGALAAAEQLGGRNLMVVWIVAGSAIGCVAAWLLYRVWMGISCAILLALAAPAASVFWEGTTLPPVVAPATQSDEEAPAETDSGQSNPLTRMIESQGQVIRTRWEDQLEPAGRRMISIAAAAGALVGLVGGLFMPNVAAAFQSALIGSLLILISSKGLVANYAPQHTGFLPHQPRTALLLLGLITAIGIAIQWTLLRSKADK